MTKTKTAPSKTILSPSPPHHPREPSALPKGFSASPREFSALPRRLELCKIITIISTAALLTACAPTINKRGNMLSDVQISQVTPNIHTRSDVLKIMGSPTTQAPFDDNLWYYIGQETEKRGILDPEVTKERIIAVRFDDEGTVQVVEELNDGRIDIPIDRNKTETQGTKTTIAQEFLGNLGRFNNSGGPATNQ